MLVGPDQGYVQSEPKVTVNTGGNIPYGQLPEISATVSSNSGRFLPETSNFQ